MKKLTILFYVGLTVCLTAPFPELYGQHQEHEYGKVDFELSCTQSASDSFQMGMALLHHMMYEQAEEKFVSAAEADPQCAMAHWGIAMSVIHPLWGERPSDEAFKKGYDAVNKAQALDPPTEREKAYIKAVEKFYEDWESTAYPEQLVAFEQGFYELQDAFPQDIDAKAFYALGHLATAPKEDKNFTQQKTAGAILEKLHKDAPDHPGLFHYTIHAYDNPALAERAVEVARAYDKIAPDVPHALHMASHIFVRQGLWPDVIEWNIRSASAALNQPVDGQTSMHYAHALDYLAYAYLQRGEDEKARRVLDKMNEVTDLQQNFAAAYAVAAINTRYALEQEDWQQAAAIPEKPTTYFPLEKYPAAESIIHYARGIGAARANDTEGARQAIEELKSLYEKLITQEETYWAVLTDAQRTSVEAWLTYAEGNHKEAVSLMQKAADIEDSVDKHPVTPGHVLPARELLGDMYLELDQPAEALLAYQASEDISANRFRSLHGMGEAAALTGDAERAVTSFDKLLELTADAESTRPQLDKAKKIVSEHQP